MAPHQIFSSAFLLFVILTQGGAVPVSDSVNNVISTQDVSKPSSKQGLLEIPKNVATLIRNTIDQTLQSYLNFTTPKPDPYRPASISNSIIGHYLLGNVYPRPVVNAPPYQPNKPIPTLSTSFFPQPTKIETAPPATPAPVKSKPPPANVEKVPATVAETVSAEATGSEEKTPAPKPRPEEPTAKPAKIHTLDTDSSITGLFNSNGLLFNSENEEDVFYIGSTKGSVIFPIATSTEAPTTPAPTTVAPSTSTSEGTGGDEDEDVEEESGTGFEEIDFKDVKASAKRV
ncbi:unnamed protein product [Orchesella dallaii]|uniref:Uncharacterized protein n=1 Tax=Orchesella dallaii TaxID=48710 RepID=A0ABP1PQY0_9HEXA